MEINDQPEDSCFLDEISTKSGDSKDVEMIDTSINNSKDDSDP